MDLVNLALAAPVLFVSVTFCDVNLPLVGKVGGLRNATVVDFAVIFHCCYI